ncbi:MAG: YtxH domain-containing protein [Chitinophagales bacterium]
MNTGKLLFGVLAGVTSGILLGILFAPDCGTATRRKIFKRGEDLLDASKDKFDEFVKSISPKFKSVKEASVELLGKEEDKINSLTAETKNAL